MGRRVSGTNLRTRIRQFELLGHASITISADVFSFLIGTIAEKAVDSAAKLIVHTVHT